VTKKHRKILNVNNIISGLEQKHLNCGGRKG